MRSEPTGLAEVGSEDLGELLQVQRSLHLLRGNRHEFLVARFERLELAHHDFRFALHRLAVALLFGVILRGLGGAHHGGEHGLVGQEPSLGFVGGRLDGGHHLALGGLLDLAVLADDGTHALAARGGERCGGGEEGGGRERFVLGSGHVGQLSHERFAAHFARTICGLAC